MTTPRKRAARHACPLDNAEEGNTSKLEQDVWSQMMKSKRKPDFGGRRNFVKTRFVLFLLCAVCMVPYLILIPSLLDAESSGSVRSPAMNKIVDRRLSPSTNTVDETSMETIDDGDYFSACILWMDDNHRLEEWLAYHYYFLKLRYVVINVDPQSKSSPQAIVDRWIGNNKVYNNKTQELLDYSLNMTIVLWNDTVYTDPTKYEFEQSRITLLTGNSRYQAATEYHKLRQPAFYKACTRHLISQREKEYQQQNKEDNTAKNEEHKRPSQWTAYFDTDEFFSFQPETIRSKSRNKYEAPGYVLKKVNQLKKNKIRHDSERFAPEQQDRQEKMKKDIEQQLQMELSLDTLSESERASKTKILQQIVTTRATAEKKSVEPPKSQTSSGLSCLVIPRNGIASTELTDEETNELLGTSNAAEALIPQEFIDEKSFLEKSNTNDRFGAKSSDGRTILRRFDTFRYKHHATGMPNYGKSILDLSQTDVQEYTKRSLPFQTHGVISSICQKKAYRGKKAAENRYTENYSIVHQEKMQLNHYVGSWESYNARPNDARKGLSDSSARFTENSKSYENWLQKSKTLSDQEFTEVRPWLKGFIRLVGGPKVAAHLLQDAGMVFPEKDADVQEMNEVHELSS